MQLIKLSSNFNGEFALIVGDKIKELLDIANTVTIAVSGGKSPIAWFEQLSKYQLDWSRVIITLVDERYTDNHNERNDSLVCKHLLINNAKLAKFVPLVNDAKTINQCLDELNSLNLKLDLVVLGMGSDAHTASIFPCCAQLSLALNEDNANDYIITNPVSANYPRIGFTLNKILEAKYIYLPLNDSSKLEVFHMASARIDDNLPISHVVAKANNFNVYTV